jgi:tRNA(Ile)-lysidine synthase
MMKKTSPKRNVPAEQPMADLPLDTSLFAPGDRICMAVSGGADSTALLRALLARQAELGIVLSVLHVEHGLRGASAARDAAFVAALAGKFSLPCQVIAVDTPKRAAEYKESIEEAARNLRYQAFREVLASGRADKVTTAHTLDDQAETVLMKLLRGAWTEGLSGIHPMLRLESAADGAVPHNNGNYICVRPLLAVTRAQIEAYLRTLDQLWCEDETNRSLVHTRNRIRHELLPALREYNPRIEHMLAHMADNARAEEQHWQAELARLLPQLLLPGRPVRGGGRSVATGPGRATVALEIVRLQTLDPGLRRRVLRAAAEQCGATLDFETTERLDSMIGPKYPVGQPSRLAKRLVLPGGVVVKRSARELQFEGGGSAVQAAAPEGNAVDPATQAPTYELPVPGTVEAPAFRAHYAATFEGDQTPDASVELFPAACLRAWQPGDRVELAHSRGPKKIKEVLDRMGIRGEERVLWPVVAWQGKIIWMRGVKLADEAKFRVSETRF